MLNKCEFTHSLGKCSLNIRNVCNVCFHGYCQFHSNCSNHRCIQSIIDVVTDENEEGEHINLRDEINNSNKNQESNVGGKNENSCDYYNIDSDDEDSSDSDNEDASPKIAVTSLSSTTRSSSSSSSSSSMTSVTTLNRNENNFTEPYFNNLENFDDKDVESALNNVGFFAVKRSTADNFATIMRVSNDNNRNMNFEVGGTITLMKNLDNKYQKLINVRQINTIYAVATM